MVDNENIEDKINENEDKINNNINETKEKFDETETEINENIDETKQKFEEKFEEKKERGKNLADNVISDFSTTVDEFKETLKNMQKAADKKYNEYKKSTVQNIDIDLIETKDIYYLKVAVPGVEKEDIVIEAGDNEVTITAKFNAYIDEIEDETAEEIVSSLKKGECAKTIRFENSIDYENIKAKYTNGTVTLTLPKLIIPKYKINVE